MGRGASAPPDRGRHPAAFPADLHARPRDASSGWSAAAIYKGPLNLTWVGIGGGFDGPNPNNFMEFIRRAPDGSTVTLEIGDAQRPADQRHGDVPWACMSRCGNEDTLYDQHGDKMTSVQQIEQIVRIAEELGREIATAKEAREIYKIGVQYNSVEETLAQLGMAPNREPGQRARCPTGTPHDRSLDGRTASTRSRRYAWVVFALTFGLLISDYMARQVLNAVFPLLKAEWALSDGQLGLLSGVVAIMVGLLTFPLSLLADRWGRVNSLTAMAVLWSLATLLCARCRQLSSRCWPAACSSASARRPMAASASPSSSASFPRACARPFPPPSWRAGCWARCSASASAAGRRRTWLADGVPRHRPCRPGPRRPLSAARPASNGWHALAKAAGQQPYERKQEFPKLGSPVRRPHHQLRLCRQRPAAVRGWRAAGLAADLFQPLLRPAGRRAPASLAALFLRSAGSAWSFAACSAIGCSAGPTSEFRLAVGYSLACAVAA